MIKKFIKLGTWKIQRTLINTDFAWMLYWDCWKFHLELSIVIAERPRTNIQGYVFLLNYDISHLWSTIWYRLLSKFEFLSNRDFLKSLKFSVAYEVWPYFSEICPVDHNHDFLKPTQYEGLCPKWVGSCGYCVCTVTDKVKLVSERKLGV